MADPATPPQAPRAARSAPLSQPPPSRRRSHVAAWSRVPRGGLLFGLTALILALMTWPVTTLEPGSGLDPSWTTALSMAVHQGLNFGPDVTFTFGPLGFLREPSLAYPWPTRLAFAYTLAEHVALCLALLWALRRNFGSLVIAAPVALVVVSLLQAEPAPVLVFAVLVGLVRAEFPPRLVPAILAATGALVAIQLLAKLNTGVVAAALCAIALAALPQRRRAGIAWCMAGLASALVAGWVIAGQTASAIPEYVRGSVQVISGYSESMGLEDPGRQWELWAALVLTVVGLVALRGDRRTPSRATIATAAMWLVLAFTAFKAGFVRHEANHANVFFATMLGGLVALPLLNLLRLSATLVLLLATMAVVASLRVDPTDLVDPIGRPDVFLSQARTLADGGATNAAIVSARDRVAREYGLDPKVVAALRGRTVDVQPHDANVAWAYRLAWKPVPVFQAYAAYTAGLDARNAAAFAAADGPERVLRRDTVAVDGRNTAWESPAAVRAMLCHYRAIVTVPPWQVLARTADRCGRPRLLETARARYGESITVPRAPSARSIVFMKLDGVAVGGTERLVSALYRAEQRAVTLGDVRTVRLVPGTAADGLLMRVPAAGDFPVPFALDQGVDEFVVTRGTGRQPDDEVGVRFYAVDLR